MRTTVGRVPQSQQVVTTRAIPYAHFDSIEVIHCHAFDEFVDPRAFHFWCSVLTPRTDETRLAAEGISQKHDLALRNNVFCRYRNRILAEGEGSSETVKRISLKTVRRTWISRGNPTLMTISTKLMHIEQAFRLARTTCSYATRAWCSICVCGGSKVRIISVETKRHKIRRIHITRS